MSASREPGTRPGGAVAALVGAAALVLVACGTADGEPTASTPGVLSAVPAETAVTGTTMPVNTTPAPTRIDESATVSTPADRLDEAIRITWIGGSDIELDDRSIPDAVMSRTPMIGDRPLLVFADTKIAPLPREVEASVEQAAERAADGLVVILNPSWLSWDGHEECTGVSPAHAYYACVLEPRPETDVDSLRDDVRSLIDTIVATGLPAYLYVIPHSAESLADPELAPILAATESRFAELDPELDRIEYVDHILSRDLEPLHEGVEFNDMVHPGDAGVQRLADHFTTEFVRFFGAHVTD